MLEKFDEKQKHMGVPEGYFEQLTKNVMSNIPSQQEQIHKPVRDKNKFLFWFTSTAVAAVLAGVVFFSADTSKYFSSGTEDNIQSLSTDANFALNDMDDYYLFLQDLAEETDYNEYWLVDNN